MKRKWQTLLMPGVKYGGRLVLGSPDDAQDEVIISLTRIERMNAAQFTVNMILSALTRTQLTKNPNLIYAELVGLIDGGVGQTLTVWTKGQDMVSFRDSSWHKIAMKFFRWVLYSGKAESYFITYKSTKIPTAEEATAILKEYGNYFDGGKQIRKAKRYAS